MKKQLLLVFTFLATAISGFAQAPKISYATAQKYITGIAITPLNPVNTGGAVPATAAYGQVTTFAGTAGPRGNANGTGPAIKFNDPQGLAVDASHNVYVSDLNEIIRKITPAGVATTFAGGTYGYVNGTGTTAKFNDPVGMAFDAAGNLYVGDVLNYRVRKITPTGVVSTFAGSGTKAAVNGTGTAASFYGPTDIAFDAAGNMYVTDGDGSIIRKVTSAGVVTTFAGSGLFGYTNGAGATAKIGYPAGITTDKSGNVYFNDETNKAVRKITPDGTVSTYAGYDPTGNVILGHVFTMPCNITCDALGNLYLTDISANVVIKISSGGVVSTLAGSGAARSNDGIGTAAGFYEPADVALDGAGILYVADAGNNTIRKIALTGYSISPALPAGLVFDGTKGTISGTPTIGTTATNYTITAYNASGSSSTILNLATYNPNLKPAITSFSPTTAAQDATITITGTNFTGASAVTIGGVAAKSFVVKSATSITAVVNKTASGSISVTTPNGIISSAGFVFIQPPAITTFSSVNPTGSQQTVTINGTNFTGVTAVSFGGIPAASFIINSATKITAVAGNGASGSIAITAPGGTTTISGFVFTSKPTITSFTPANAKTGATVTITGTNLSGATAVSFGGVAASTFTKTSATNIIATVATGASGSISVTTPNGTATKTGFTYNALPVISSFAPSTGGAGTKVVITGTGFTGATVVSFGGVPASAFTVNSATTITATVAAGLSGAIVIITPIGQIAKSGFTYVPPPTITSFTPLTGSTGTKVVITGNYFTGATAVTIGGKPATSFVVTSATTISAYVGSGASGSVAVTTPYGSVSRTGFIYTAPPKPAITSFSPASAKTGTIVTIKGTNLIGATAVSFGGVAASSFSVTSATSITAVIGSGASGTVSVTTPGGAGTLTGFTYLQLPVITSFTPTSTGSFATVTINGTGFTGATAVHFGSSAAYSFTVNSANKITAVVAAGNTGPVSVTTPAGTGSLAGFTFISEPLISSITPTTGGTGTVVTLIGFSFAGATSVNFGGVPAKSFTINSIDQITAVVGAGASGPVSVTTPGGMSQFSGFTFTSAAPAPVITSFSPTTAASASTVTIKGINLTGVTSVVFGYSEAKSFTVVNSTTITAVVNDANSGAVSIYSPAGKSSLAGFTFVPKPYINAESATTFTQGGSVVLYSFGGNGVTSQWAKNGTDIAGATDTIYTAKTTGSYILKFTANAVTTQSDPVVVTVLAPASVKAPYPNPFQNTLSINLGEDKVSSGLIKVYNVKNGKLMLTQKVINQSGVVKIDLSGLDSGIYSLNTSMDNVESASKVIKK